MPVFSRPIRAGEQISPEAFPALLQRMQEELERLARETDRRIKKLEEEQFK